MFKLVCLTHLHHIREIVIPSGVPPAQNPRSSARDHERCVVFLCKFVVSLFVLFIIFRRMGGCFFCKLCENGPTFVEQLMKTVSRRALGEVLGALGVPLGLNVGPRLDFDRFLERFRHPSWMFFRCQIYVFSNSFFDTVVDVILYAFGSIL